ncbi:hypothetical protein ALC57_03669 [Trachymyrmex cornetzi]|uniref:Uncharacterized protein n=1 Tax=Trachymyrmex cornetzi TaxID=471704 RepID=A0A195EGE6_9HYME|nr:hypothetical protein ALC57_03669 [Trachymyrmex cornetzi]
MKITLSTPAKLAGHGKHNGRQRRTNCVPPQYCSGRRKWKLRGKFITRSTIQFHKLSRNHAKLLAGGRAHSSSLKLVFRAINPPYL